MQAFFIIVLVVVFFSFILLGFNIFFRNKNFPETEIGRNKAMRKLGLSCPRCEEMKTYKKAEQSFSIDPKKLKVIR
jgi:hypothetical protein